MDWLHTWMTEAGACPSGYEVIKRKPVQTATIMGKPAYRIYYTVQCT